MDYDFRIIHKPGEENIADYLSRHPRPIQVGHVERHTWLAEQYIHFVAVNNALRSITMEELIKETKADYVLTSLLRALQDNKVPSSGETKAYSKIWKELSVWRGELVLRGNRIVVSMTTQERIVALAHEGHQGDRKNKNTS